MSKRQRERRSGQVSKLWREGSHEVRETVTTAATATAILTRPS